MSLSLRTAIRANLKVEVVEEEVNMMMIVKVKIVIICILEDSVDENNENDYMLNLREDLKNNGGDKKKKRKDATDGK